MKTVTLGFILVAASLVLSGPALAAAPPDDAPSRFTGAKLLMIEENLLLGLTSDIPGIRATAALTLRQVKEAAPHHEFSRAIIPLMRIVKDENCDIASRVTASLALHSLASDRGDYAIKMTGYFTEHGRVKTICEHLAYARLQEKLASR